jgi:hypothetical protein
VLAGSEADCGDWAEDELGGVTLGDARLTSRLVALARSLANAPDTSLPQALPKWSELKAAYRFFDNAKAVPDHILFGHIEATRSRTRTVPIVLAVKIRRTSIGSIIRRHRDSGGCRMRGGASSATVLWP